MPKEEPHRLHKEHHRKRHSDSCSGLCIDLTNEECVCNVVQSGHKHGYNCGYSHRYYNTMYRSLRQESVVVCMSVHNLITC